jgi:antirestriction protein
MRIYLTNLGKYNEGVLLGKWVTLPCTGAELQAVLKTIGIGGRYEETFITDYENDLGLRINEYASLRELNEVAERIDLLDTHELITLQAVIDHEAPDIADVPEIIDRLDEYHLYSGVGSDEELGAYWIHEVGGYDLDRMGELANYIDYEAYGRDIRLNSCNSDFTQYGWLQCS